MRGERAVGLASGEDEERVAPWSSLLVVLLCVLLLVLVLALRDPPLLLLLLPLWLACVATRQAVAGRAGRAGG